MKPPRPRLNRLALFSDLGYQPTPGQMQVHASSARRRIVACGVRWGKTHCAAVEGLCAALEPRERSIGWVVAPTYDLSDRVFRAIVLLAFQHLRHRVVKLREHDHLLVLRNAGGGLSEIRGKSADNPTSLLGEGLDWVVLDEAARMKPLIWESHLSQRLLDKRGWALLISTPRGKGWFYDAFRKGQGPGHDPDYASWNYPSWTSPHLDAALIEQERSRLPERVFRQEYGGEFIEGAGAVFRYVREAATGSFAEPVNCTEYFAGLDLARIDDFSVLVILDRKREVVFVDRFHRVDWSLQIARIKAALKRFNQPRVFVDSTGAGEPILEQLCKEDVHALAYPFTSKSKSALIDNLSLLLEQRLIKLPKPELWPEGIDELESFEYSITDHGSVRTSAPSGVHDDCVVALALAAWHLRPRHEHSQMIAAPLVFADGRWSGERVN